jgi:RNA polymerase sigma-70 factor (ECF subfamily)
MFMTAPATVLARADVLNTGHTDDELLRRIAAGDDRAFAELYRRHADAARATARRVCRCGHMADDATQHAFLALWRDAPRFRPSPGGPVAWLHTIVRNRGIDLLRQAKARERCIAHDDRALLDAPSGDPLPDDVVSSGHRRTVMRAALAELPDPQRDVIVLAYYGELTQAEIAARLMLSLGTVKGRTRLALHRLARDPAVRDAADAPH